MAFLSEAQLEAALLDQLASLGYASVSDDLIGPDGKQPERDANDESSRTAVRHGAIATQIIAAATIDQVLLKAD